MHEIMTSIQLYGTQMKIVRLSVIVIQLIILVACKIRPEGVSILSPTPEAVAITETAPVLVPTTVGIPTVQPTRISLPVQAPSPIREIAVAGPNVIALLEDGTVWVLAMPGPHPVKDLTDVTAIAHGGWYHRIALKSDGTVWAWGENKYGQLGDGTLIDRDVVQVTGLSHVVAVGAGTRHSLALTDNGEVWTWGDNAFGQLGDGSSTKKLSTTPVKAIGLSNVTAILGCGDSSVALKKDGTLWAWGANNTELFGDVNTSGLYSNIPVQIKGIEGVTDIACGGHMLAVKSDGSVWAWGSNESRQVGINSYGDPVATPIRIEGLTEVANVAASSQSSFILKLDGTVWSWGSNLYLELGYTTPRTVQETPSPMPGMSDVIAIAADAEHAALLRNDGTVWIWGNDLLVENVVGDVLKQTGPIYVFGP